MLMHCCLQDISAITFNTIEYQKFSTPMNTKKYWKIPKNTEKYRKIPKILTGDKKKSQKI